MKHLKFFIVNLIVVTVCLGLTLLFWSGLNDRFPIELLSKSIVFSSLIIVFQYPLMKYYKSWLYKSLILYLSMLLFLFVFGLLVDFKWESGFKMMFIGQGEGYLYAISNKN